MADNNDFVEDVDPKLKELRGKIEAMLEEYQVSGSFQLASSTHGEFGISIPEWSAIRPDKEGLAIRIKSSVERDGPQHLESSVHMLFSMRDMVIQQAVFMDQLCEMIETTLNNEGIEVEHKPLWERGEDDVPQGTGKPN